MNLRQRVADVTAGARAFGRVVDVDVTHLGVRRPAVKGRIARHVVDVLGLPAKDGVALDWKQSGKADRWRTDRERCRRRTLARCRLCGNRDNTGLVLVGNFGKEMLDLN